MNTLINQVINTNSGPIKGQWRTTDANKEFVAFSNIPYVKSFVGDRRFKDPEPVERWSEILDATKEGPASLNIDPFRADNDLCEGSLESLGINVFTPNVSLIRLLLI